MCWIDNPTVNVATLIVLGISSRSALVTLGRSFFLLFGSAYVCVLKMKEGSILTFSPLSLLWRILLLPDVASDGHVAKVSLLACPLPMRRV